MKTMAYTAVDRTLVVVYGHEDPTESEWNAYLAFVLAHGVEGTMQLVVTDGGEPSRAQADRLRVLLGGRRVPVAVLTSSPRVRLLVTALSWVNRGIRAFPRSGLREAIAYLEIPASRIDVLTRTILDLRAELDADSERRGVA